MLLSKKVLSWHERHCLTFETSHVTLNSYRLIELLRFKQKLNSVEFDISDLIGLGSFPAVSNAYFFIFMFDAPPFFLD